MACSYFGFVQQGIDQLRPNLTPQMQKQFMQSPNQFQLVMPQQQQQQLLAQAQAQAHGNLASSPNYGEMDPRKLKGLVRNSLNGKEGQPSGADGSTGSPIQSSSPKVRAQEHSDYVMKVKFFIYLGTIYFWSVHFSQDCAFDSCICSSMNGQVYVCWCEINNIISNRPVSDDFILQFCVWSVNCKYCIMQIVGTGP